MIGFYYTVDIIIQTANDPDCEGVWYPHGKQSMKNISMIAEKYMYDDSFSVLIKVILGSIMMVKYFLISLQPLSQHINIIMGKVISL